MFENYGVNRALVVQWLTNQSSNPAAADCFPRGENMNFLFISDVVNLLLKTNGERKKA